MKVLDAPALRREGLRRAATVRGAWLRRRAFAVRVPAPVPERLPCKRGSGLFARCAKLCFSLESQISAVTRRVQLLGGSNLCS